MAHTAEERAHAHEQFETQIGKRQTSAVARGVGLEPRVPSFSLLSSSVAPSANEKLKACLARATSQPLSRLRRQHQTSAVPPAGTAVRNGCRAH